MSSSLSLPLPQLSTGLARQRAVPKGTLLCRRLGNPCQKVEGLLSHERAPLRPQHLYCTVASGTPRPPPPLQGGGGEGKTTWDIEAGSVMAYGQRAVASPLACVAPDPCHPILGEPGLQNSAFQDPKRLLALLDLPPYFLH